MFKYLLLAIPLLLSHCLLANDSLNPCLQNQHFKVVVLGSSTAAGSGPSSPDSAWVNRYRNFLQSINNQNEVINLAQGGTTTYHIMPDWYAAPTGKPTRNTSRNVSEAIRQQADAIIVNMPSNDAARGFSLQEQMANFTLISQVADSAGIPVWVCTTQPRNFNNAKVHLQQDVRDSILSQFGPKAIDFWSGFADSTGQLHPSYDSGDGVHMNDAAHRILFQRVRQKNILSALVDTLGSPDHFISYLKVAKSSCGTTHDTLFLSLSNRGSVAGYKLPLKWTITNLGTASTQTIYDSISTPVHPCENRLLKLPLNTSAGGQWQIHAQLLTQGESFTSNDYSDTLILNRSTPPAIAAMGDTVCEKSPARLWASGGDTLLWYDDNDNLIAYGDSLHTAPLSQNRSFRAVAATGPFYYIENLPAATSTNIDWNGIMFDLVARDSLVLDSLSLMVENAGTVGITAYTLARSYKGYENTASAWTLWGTDTLHPASAGSLVAANFGSKSLAAGDTLGVYLQMESGHDLLYLGLSSEASFSDPQLELISGTGVSHNFGQTYYPRGWAGQVHYHHGYNPLGQCHSDTTITAVVSQTEIRLGADTALFNFHQRYQLAVDSGFQNILWSTGDTTDTISINATQIYNRSDTFNIWVQAENRFGCSATDSIRVEIHNYFSLPETAGQALLDIYPNPASDQLHFNNRSGHNLQLQLLNLQGQILQTLEIPTGRQQLSLQQPPGLYLLTGEGMGSRKLMVR